MIIPVKMSLIVTLCAAAALPFAAQSASSGSVSFAGSIVEDACTLQPVDQHVKVYCPSGNMTLPVASRADSKRFSQTVPQLASVDMHWKDVHHRLGVMTITYQ